MLENISGSFEFHAALEYSFLSQEFWALWENSDARIFLSFENFILPENYGHFTKVDENFHFFSPNIFGHTGKSLTLQNKLGQFGNCILPNKFGQIIKNEFFWGYCPQFWVLSDMRERERVCWWTT